MELKKIEAPRKLPKSEPKGKCSKGSCDFRVGGGK